MCVRVGWGGGGERGSVGDGAWVEEHGEDGVHGEGAGGAHGDARGRRGYLTAC